MTYPFAGEIKMNKVIKDGKEVIEWEQVDMSLHSAGNLGIGTQPTGNISFISTYALNSTEVLRLSKDGIWANPDIPADDAAKLVLAAMEWNIKVLVDEAVADERERIYFQNSSDFVKSAIADEREACARICDTTPPQPFRPSIEAAHAIRARSNT